MIFARFGRSVLLAGAAVLIIAFAYDSAAAEAWLVTSDEAALLPPTVTLAVQDGRPLEEIECWRAGLAVYQHPKLEQVIDPRIQFPSPSAEGSLNAFWQHEITFCDDEDASVAEDALLAFSPAGELAPVVRAQSPSIELLPLDRGESSIENTSILSAITGTKGRLRGDYQTDFGGTTRIGVQAITQTWLGIGVDTETNYWQRQVPGLGSEPLWTGDLNVIYSFVPHPRFKLRSGAGAAWKYDDGKARAGYNITHGLDVYLLWRFMLSGEIDWGAIRHDKLFHYRAALGLTWQGMEFFTGYDSYKLGSERLDGWVNGVQFWY